MVKKLTVIGLILLIIGIIGSVLTIGSRQKESVNVQEDISKKSYSNIHIQVGSTDLELRPVKNVDEARVELTGRGMKDHKKELDINISDDTLNITLENAKKHWFNFQWGFKDLKLKIYVPEKVYKNLDIKGASSDMYVDKVGGKHTQVRLASGDILVKNLEVDSLDINSSSGDIVANDIVGDVSTKVKSGDIALKNITANEIDARAKSGEVVISNFLGELNTETKSGDIYIRTDEITKPITGKASSGDIIVESKKEIKNARFDINTRSGDALILDNKGNHSIVGEGGLLIKLNTSSGDILVK